jgi:hypothetical protein
VRLTRCAAYARDRIQIFIDGNPLYKGIRYKGWLAARPGRDRNRGQGESARANSGDGHERASQRHAVGFREIEADRSRHGPFEMTVLVFWRE